MLKKQVLDRLKNFSAAIMKRAVFLTILLCEFAVFGFSQTGDQPYRIGAALGYSFSGYREETYTAINRHLNTFFYRLDGNIEKRSFLHTLNAGFFMGNSTIKAEEAYLFEDYDSQNGKAYYIAYNPQYLSIRGYIEYALDKKLWGSNTFPGYLGGAFRADTYLQFANYPSITGLLSLDVHAVQKWHINRDNVLTGSLSVPLFGYAVRPPYAGADAAIIKYASESPMKILSLGKIVSLHNYWAVFGDVSYRHVITSLVSFYTGMGFELSRINFPRPRIDAICTLNTGIAFTF